MEQQGNEVFISEEETLDDETKRNQHNGQDKPQIISTTMEPVHQVAESRSRRSGVTEVPDMNVVIGYNMSPDGFKREIPRIMIQAEPFPDPKSIRLFGLPGFEPVNDCQRVLFRLVPGNAFFYELVKTNPKQERVFLICEPTEGINIANVSGQNFKILFVGREGTELLAIRPCTKAKESVSVIYKEQEIGRIVRHSTGGDGSATTHTILDRKLKELLILRKKVEQVETKTWFFNKKKVTKYDPNAYNVFAAGNVQGGGVKEAPVVASISMVDTDINFNSTEPAGKELGLVEKTLLLATLVAIKTKAVESAGIGFRISLTF